MTEHDLVIRRASLLKSGGQFFDIGVSEGRISKIARSLPGRGTREIDARGRLVLPSFVEPHVHLDKALLAEEIREASSISEARELVRDAKKKFTRLRVRERVEKVLPWAIESGIGAIRTHVDVDPYAKLASIEALLELRAKYSSLDIQIVAFPQEGIFESIELLNKALDLGAGVIGGLPEAEKTREDSRRHIEKVLDIAETRKIDVDIHCDVLPSGRNAEYYASEVIKRRREGRFEGRATADHLIALSYCDDAYARKIIGLIKEAHLNVISNPCTMMTSGSPMARGVTRIKELMASGVNLSYGQDNVIDPYNPFGDLNPLTNGFLLSYAGQLNSGEELEQILAMDTHNAAAILGLENYGLDVGCFADLNVLNAASPRDALRLHSKPAYVVRRGKVIENKETW